MKAKIWYIYLLFIIAFQGFIYSSAAIDIYEINSESVTISGADIPVHAECFEFTSSDSIQSISHYIALYLPSGYKYYADTAYISFEPQGDEFKVDSIIDGEIMLNGGRTSLSDELERIGGSGRFILSFHRSSAQEDRVNQRSDLNQVVADNGNRETLLDQVVSSGVFDSELLDDMGFFYQDYYDEFNADFLKDRIKNPEILAGLLFGCLQNVGGRSELGLYGMLGLFGLAMAEGQGINGAPEFGALLDLELDDTVLEQVWVAATTMTLNVDRMAMLLNSTNVENHISLGKMLTTLYSSQEEMLLDAHDSAREMYVNLLDVLLPENWSELSNQEIGRSVIEQLQGDDLTLYDKFLVFSSVLFPYFLSLHMDDGLISGDEVLESGYCPLGGVTQREKDINPNEGKNILWYVLALSTSMMQPGDSRDFVNLLSEIYDDVDYGSISSSIIQLDDQLQDYRQSHNRAVLDSIDFVSPANNFYDILSDLGYFGDVI
ncbi:MAG: hypothetical protein P9M06_05930 [Candidatus Saelkia tenebricola]|nr:hypothetical protein [Candidatus Saelkia tenebricola]